MMPAKAPDGVQRVHFSRKAIDQIVVPETKDRVYVFDDQTPALAVCRTKAGATSFYCYRRVRGRPKRIRIGGYPELTIEQARRRCADLNMEIAAGKDPQMEKQVARGEATFADLFTDFMEKHAKPKKRPATATGYEWLHKKYLKTLDGRPASTIDTAAVQTLHVRIGSKHGHYAANRALALIHSVFQFAYKDTKPNPAKGVEKFVEEERERFLTPEEMPKFMAALRAEADETIRDAITLLLLSGARKGNCFSAEWSEFNLPLATWTIPAEKAKGGKSYAVPLCPSAMELLIRRRKIVEKTCPWVFPSVRAECGHLVEIKAAWSALLKRAGIEDLRVHDLRRTVGSWMASLGEGLPIIGKTLGHITPSATAIYARLQTDPVRLALNRTTSAMLEAAGPPALPPPETTTNNKSKGK